MKKVVDFLKIIGIIEIERVRPGVGMTSGPGLFLMFRNKKN